MAMSNAGINVIQPEFEASVFSRIHMHNTIASLHILGASSQGGWPDGKTKSGIKAIPARLKQIQGRCTRPTDNELVTESRTRVRKRVYSLTSSQAIIEHC